MPRDPTPTDDFLWGADLGPGVGQGGIDSRRCPSRRGRVGCWQIRERRLMDWLWVVTLLLVVAIVWLAWSRLR